MGISVDEIMRLYTERQQSYAPEHAQMRELTAAYDGTVAVPLPELDRNEKVAVANLIAVGLDQTAMRIASTLPDVFFPSVKPGVALSEKNASLSRKAVLGWWDTSEMDLKLARRARWLIGYACSPVTLRWDAKNGVPRWVLRDPLSTFPARGDDPDCMVPDDCLFGFKRSLSWLQVNYPDQTMRLSKGKDVRPDSLFELVEYTDSSEVVLVVVGKARDPHDRQGAFGVSPHEELDRVGNRTGLPLTYVPGRISLSSRRTGAYDGLIGLYQQQAKLMALETIAVTRGVFQDEWLVARPNERPNIVQMANGRRGVLGVVEGGEIVQQSQQPGYKTDSTIDRLERAMRTEGGIPSDFTGESATNVRTGKRGDSILSATVDFPIQEAQRILARSLRHEDECAIAMAKAYAGNTPKTFYLAGRGKGGRVDYVPNKNLVSAFHTVSFPMPGMDGAEAIVGLGQRAGIGELSMHTIRQLDPMCDDPEAEADWLVKEKLEAALMASLQQQAQGGQLGVADLARISDAVVTGRQELFAAVIAVHNEKQVEQATSGPPGSPAGPVAGGAPEAQPGLTPQGAGAPPAAGTIAPTPDEAGLAQLLGALRGGAKGVAA